MFKRIIEEIDSVFSRDPAARSRLEVFFCYPGFHAILLYRFSHFLWKSGLKLPARFISFFARFLTGVEIHPGATIGKNLFIDHGMGVVIGETATIGDHVTLYHGVTLGGTSLSKGIRHPQLGNDVIVGAGAQLLGPIKIGNNARIGSNAVVVKDVEPDTTVVGIPARAVSEKDTSHAFSPYATGKADDDPVTKALDQLQRNMDALHQRVAELEQENAALASTARKWENK